MRALGTLGIVFLGTIHTYANADAKEEQVLVLGGNLFKDTTTISPTSRITEKELQYLNVQTVEDAIGHEPSLIIRRRFIGDPNGVIGIRGSNMFQGTRSMVFADGLPLHYHLQTRFSGSPRWSLVSPSEVELVDVIYGPFSAEYSGNAMGGVVKIKTKTPEERKFTLQGSLFSQDYSLLSTDDNFNGGRLFAAYEDRFDDLSIHLSYNHLENESQPLTQFDSTFEPAGATSADNARGGILGRDEFDNDVIYYGDSGAEKAITDLFKAKFVYDLETVKFRGTIAYEQRSRDEERFNNFITDTNGNSVWNGAVVQDGLEFNVSGRNFQERHQERDSLLVGFGVTGDLGNDWSYDAFYSRFSILDDEEIRTGRNPADPDFVAQNAQFRGRITTFDDTGWDIFDAKFGTESLFGDDQQRLSVGVHIDSYELNIIADDFDSVANVRASDEVDGNRSTGRADSGGEASTLAIFAQYGYRFNDQWDLAIGLRYEDWESENGFSGSNTVDPRSESGFSPKLSLGYTTENEWEFRYSVARALRFPIVEELFRNDGATSDGSVFISDPSLEPEDGIFHNFSIEKGIENGSVRLNLFADVVDDVIFNQSTRTDIRTVTSSLPVDEVTTLGAEFAINQDEVFGSLFNIRYNLSYIDSEITENVLNPEIIGNEFPRMPRWRSNLIINYPILKSVDVSGSVRYASDSSGRLDNADTAEEVFGAHDDFLFFGAKANWNISDETQVSFGIDNITNEIAYVFHPWPSRTFYLEAKHTFGGGQ